jgi:hypothetical protein
MACEELVRLKVILEQAREQLRQTAPESALSFAEEPAWSTRERTLRTTIFSAEIDAAFHAAKCPHCGPGTIPGRNLAAEVPAA